MSLLSAFALSCHTQAAAIIGAETVTVGDSSLSCVLSEIADSKEFGDQPGYNAVKRLQAVCRTDALPTASILKKSATARGESFRVEALSRGAVFTAITLEQITKA